MLKKQFPTLFALLLAAGAHTAYAATIGAENCRVVLPEQVEVANETVEWKGPCANGYAEGKGVLQRYVDKKQIASFDGLLAQGMMAEGYEQAPNGDQYEGQYKNGLREGKGSWYSKDGTLYDGEWRAGQRAGMGTITFGLGGAYTGPWSNGKPSGVGKVTYAGGQRTESGVAFPVREQVNDKSAEKFRIKKTALDSLDRFATNITGGSTIPFNKSYADMTPEQQARVRSVYPLLHADDVPPYPEKGTEQIFRWLHQAQSTILTDGLLSVVVEVDAGGKAKTITVYESPDEKMAEVIKVILFNQKFTPAQCGGTPCAMRYPFKVIFTVSSPGYH